MTDSAINHETIAAFEEHVSRYIRSRDCYGYPYMSINEDNKNSRVEFVPCEALTKFWNVERVRDLHWSDNGAIVPIDKQFLDKYLISFSILVSMSRPGDINMMVNQGLDDSSLPIEEKLINGTDEPKAKQFLEDFSKHQWKFCPLILNNDRPFKRELHPYCILPISEKQLLFSKGLGDELDEEVSVYKAKWHPSCSGLTQRSGLEVVLKEYRTKGDNSEVFQMVSNKVDIYSNLGNIDFDHIVRYYGSISQQDTFSLILEYAGKGNLFDYFETVPRPQTASDRAKFWHSFFKLLLALDSVHHLYKGKNQVLRGVHQNIQPQNILVFPGPNNAPGDVHFKLADFGIGHVQKCRNQGVNHMAAQNIGNSMYRSPESYRDDGIMEAQSPRCDVWSLGAVASEALVWSIQGESGRRKYQQQRRQQTRQTSLEGGYNEGSFHDGNCRLPIVDEQHQAALKLVDDDENDPSPIVSSIILERMLIADPLQCFDAGVVFQDWERCISGGQEVDGPTSPTLTQRFSAFSGSNFGRHSTYTRPSWTHRSARSLDNPSTKQRASVPPDYSWASPSDIHEVDEGDDGVDGDTLTSTMPATRTALSEYSDNTKVPPRASMFHPPVPTSHIDSGYASAPSESQTRKGAGQAIPGRETILEEIEPQEANDDTNFSDVATDFTGASSVDSLSVTAYIVDFSQGLLNAIPPGYLDEATIGHLETALPQLLKEFAIKIGHHPPTVQHSEIMRFVRKHRAEISQQFREAHLNADAMETDPIPRDKSKPSLKEIMDDWYQRTDTDTPVIDQTTQPPPPPPHDGPTDTTNDEGTFSDEVVSNDEGIDVGARDFQQYRDCLASSFAYEWLLETLKRQVLLTSASPDIKGGIRWQILKSLPRSGGKVSRRAPSEAHSALFKVNWDPVSFIEEQKYSVSPGAAVAAAVTITGSVQDAQALASEQYVRQTWHSTSILRLIQDVLRRAPGVQCSVNINLPVTLADQATVQAHLSGSTLWVTVHGPEPSIADVGEQLAWFGAALRSSPPDERYKGMWYCFPTVTLGPPVTIQLPSQPDTTVQGGYFKIDFRFEMTQVSDLNGQCWHSMFRNPVIVRGYPIAKRHEKSTGLEMPLAAMAQLIRCKYLTVFDDMLFFKGFSSMLALNERKGDLLLWHFYYNPGGGRISYLEHTNQLLEDFTEHHLDTSRHIVGWCSKVKIYAGAVDGIYNVNKSRLPRTNPECVLDRFSISGGKHVAGGISFALGVRDTPEHVPRSDYVSKLEAISTKYVILWDEDTNRGWLVNGPTALLHLVRASLKHSETGKARQVYYPAETKDPETPYTADTAMTVLLLQENRDLPLYVSKIEKSEEREGESKDAVLKAKTFHYRFEDRVEEIYANFEKLVDYQIKVENRSGYPIRLRSRKRLEGWEFRHLAMRRYPINPVVKTLPTVAKGWVDFTRDIHAITLFGRGFGDIFRPTEPNTLCQTWSQVPPDKHYLAASVSDLVHIMDLDKDDMANPFFDILPMSESTVWHAPRDPFKPCPCHCAGAGHTKEHTNPVDVLFFKKWKSKLQKKEMGVRPEDNLAGAGHTDNHTNPVQVLFPINWECKLEKGLLSVRLDDTLDGAVIFGDSPYFRWWWKDNGDPKKGQPPEEPVELDAGPIHYRDSGIGSGSGNEAAPTQTPTPTQIATRDLSPRRPTEPSSTGDPEGIPEAHSTQGQPEDSSTSGSWRKAKSKLHPRALIKRAVQNLSEAKGQL
ncbi:hypothetical protein OQA88_5272 [Cercophora sp. LCS_1]